MFLERIVAKTQQDLQQRKQEVPIEELYKQVAAQSKPRDLLETFEDRHTIHMIAEIKKASPSKGILAPHIDPVELARTYEANGAAAISVLTEPHFFLGSPDYLKAVKQAVNIPVLRKDFIIDEYQIYEARAWGADIVLLICAILDDQQLQHLLQTANSLRMRSLVEVHTLEEAQRAVKAGAVIIGVNSRNLVTFEMNPYLIRDIRNSIPPDRYLIAESGLHSAADTRRLSRYDVSAMLIGESLVISPDVPAHMHMLLHGANKSTQVKICGLRAPEHINAATEAGADMLGAIFYKPSHRYVEPAQFRTALNNSASFVQPKPGASRPDLVGVFVNEDASYINEVADQVGLHYIQLHGHESPDFCTRIHRPVIKALSLQEQSDLTYLKDYQDVAWRLLLDTPTQGWGGSGKTHNWDYAQQAAQQQRIILAGGLTIDNIESALQQVQPWGVDVSSGVESNKQKDTEKIRTFIKKVREYDAKRSL